MKRAFYAVFILMCALLHGCKNEKISGTDEAGCLKVKSVAEYCISEKPLYLIQFLQPTTLATQQKSDVNDSTIYLAAILELPESFQRRDSIFYMKSHYDPVSERKYRPSICQAVFGPVKILVCDEVSSQPCQ